MNLLDALHNLVHHIVNRTADVHAATELLHGAMIASGHNTAAVKLDEDVAKLDLATGLVQASASVVAATLSNPDANP